MLIFNILDLFHNFPLQIYCFYDKFFSILLIFVNSNKIVYGKEERI